MLAANATTARRDCPSQGGVVYRPKHPLPSLSRSCKKLLTWEASETTLAWFEYIVAMVIQWENGAKAALLQMQAGAVVAGVRELDKLELVCFLDPASLA